MNAFSKQYGVRSLAGKLRRRAKRLAGRPDNSPWVLEPERPKRDTYVDFIFGLDYLSPNAKLGRIFQEKMGAYGMSVLLANKANVEKVTREIEAGLLRPSVYLDLSSYPGDAFQKLLHTAARYGVHTIRHVDHTQWIMKAQGHPQLEKAGLPVPPSVIFGANDPDRDLTADELGRIGERCVIKPSGGGAGKGVVIGVPPTKAAIAEARNFDRRDDWLVQRMMTWTRFGERPAYLRGFGVCGHKTLLWWHHKAGGSGGYEALTWKDLETYRLQDAIDLVDRLQTVTGMDYFSVEIAVTKETGPDRLCLIDYVNDQCDLDTEAHPEYSPPETFTLWAVERLAEFAWRKKRNLPPPAMRGLFLHDEG